MALRTARPDQSGFDHISLCAGYGGLDLGIKIAEPRARAVCFVEREAHAAAALVARMEDTSLAHAPIWDDLKTFDGRSWRGAIDGLTAGYPCQPFSYSGKRRGASDPRHLWPHVARIIREAQPQWVFLENVKGHITLGLAEVGADLRRMGYRAKAGLFSAAEARAPHWRERLFILAYADRADGGQHAALEDRHDRLPLRALPRRRLADRPQARGADVDRNQVVSRVDRRMAGAARFDVPLYPPAPGDLPAWGRTIAERPDLEPAVLRTADGMADWVDRSTGTGNGVCPLAAALAFRTLSADFERGLRA